MSTQPQESHDFYPRNSSGKRIRLVLSPDDAKKVGRGKNWRATVADLITGEKFVLYTDKEFVLCSAAAGPHRL